MKRLFIIGNGFDIAHGLPTKYSDFRDFLRKHDFSFFEKIFEIYKYSFRRIIHPVTHEILNLNDEVKDEYGLLWQDFEISMGNINESIIPNKYEFRLEWEDEYDDQIRKFIDQDIKKFFYEVYEHLQNKLDEWISNIDITNLTKKSLLINKKNYDLYLNFNYTRVLEEVYNIEEGICHIHGEMGETPLIMGHNNKDKIVELEKELDYLTFRNIKFLEQEGLEDNIDAIEENEEEETNDEFTERRKCEELLNFYKETWKNSYYYIEKNHHFFENISDIEEILIIGHSLNEIDMPYFEYIFSKVNSDVKWKVYYYLEKDKEIFKNKILGLGVEEDNIEVVNIGKFWK